SKSFCSSLPTVECDGHIHKMSLKNCQLGHKYIYCAKTAEKRTNGEWRFKDGVYTTFIQHYGDRCEITSKKEVQIILSKHYIKHFDFEDLDRI
ncbi:hypothetical protein PFISCL1PPCAC_1356, partial [Pristionchus fissidentatus]